ncbi:hypothetical protein JCM8097_001354 [Rhodosporidiobolus ruineniae]
MCVPSLLLPTSSALPPVTGPSPTPPNAFIPGHHPHSSSLSSLSSFLPSLSQQPPSLLPQTNHTRILLLADFDPQLKTKDLQEALQPFHDEPGGLKLKWRDDTSAYIVFGEPAVAKRAFLQLVTQPPPNLTPHSTSPQPKVEPYTGPEAQQILQAVQNRPRARSIAGAGGAGGASPSVPPTGGHSRKSSLLGSGGGSALGAAIASAQAAGPHGAATSSASATAANSPNGHGHHRTGSGSGSSAVGVGGGHARTGSWSRASISSPLSGGSGASGLRIGSGSGSSPSSNSPTEGFPAAANGLTEGRASPETPGASTGGVIAGEPPRRFGGLNGPGGGGNGAGSGHQRRESRSGADAVAASVAGLTINE